MLYEVITMNVAELILAGGADAAPALIQGDALMTHGELRQRVASLADGFRARGLAKGDRVGIWSENSFFFVTAYLGIIRAGLVAVPLQTSYNFV